MIKSLDDLTTFLKMCRKQGVIDIKFEGIAVTFAEPSRKVRKEGDVEEADDTDQHIPSDELTPEQLLFFSAGGAPDQ